MTLIQNMHVAQAKQGSLHLFVLVITKTTSMLSGQNCFITFVQLPSHLHHSSGRKTHISDDS